jgi:hypothetical protein
MVYEVTIAAGLLMVTWALGAKTDGQRLAALILSAIGFAAAVLAALGVFG